ncbi:hypothetical protein CUS_7235 [Ruminococcus albus 8]|uniref:Uncharacterized protein n=1 Tax=Ruminococcus albus 8 TaxID=246199 RepID=E9SDN6_RUMAL|nr:hypothetical protein CUS_7235 [Ruminococcus albus 8]
MYILSSVKLLFLWCVIRYTPEKGGITRQNLCAVISPLKHPQKEHQPIVTARL